MCGREWAAEDELVGVGDHRSGEVAGESPISVLR